MLDRIQHTVETGEDGRKYTIIEGETYVLDSITTNLRVLNSPELNDWRVKYGREESNRLRDEGALIGTMVHEAGLRLFTGSGYGTYEWSCLGVPSELDGFVLEGGKYVDPVTRKPPDPGLRKDERVRNAIVALELMRREHKLLPVGAEWFVWSKEHLFAGTCDLPAWTDETHTAVDIYDWKTSDRIYVKAWMQLAAYAGGFSECYGIPVRRIIPVRLDRGAKTLPLDAESRPIRRAHYELGDTIKGPDGKPIRRLFKEGEQIDEAFEAYLHAQELGNWIKSQGGRY